MSDTELNRMLRDLPQDPGTMTANEREQLQAAADRAVARLRARGQLGEDTPGDQVGVALCARGQLGLVVSYGPVSYPDGTGADAYRGWYLTDLGRRWSSRRPRWLVAPREDPRPANAADKVSV